jgi:hypothetical protein
MKNSYIYKNADPSFDTYFQNMKKRTRAIGAGNTGTLNNLGAMVEQN